MKPSDGALLLGFGLVGFALARAGLGLAQRQREALPRRKADADAPPGREKVTRIARRLDTSAAILSLSVLADSGIEHYRGSFQNRAMYTPLVVSSLTLVASVAGAVDERPRRHAPREAIRIAAALTGFAGFGFHVYNIDKRPGGFSWLNLFYAAPIGAPIAMTLAGLMGTAAERVRDTPADEMPRLLGELAGSVLACVTAIGLLGTVGEAALLHFRGAYHNPAMFLPVSLPPVAAALVSACMMRPAPAMLSIARWWLRATAALGFIGVGFHAFGVSRNMGGWRNWSQNILNGPPLPAPPSFTGLALAGLAALDLLEVHHERSLSRL